MSKDSQNDLLLSTYEQYSENQRQKELSFLKLSGFLGGVILGYAYSFMLSIQGQITTNIFGLVSVSTNLLLLAGAWYISSTAYSFRRDQYILFKIRLRFKLAGKKNTIFPTIYNPLSGYFVKKTSLFTKLFPGETTLSAIKALPLNYKRDIEIPYLRWMPDVYIIYYCLFPLFMSLVVFLYSMSTIGKVVLGPGAIPVVVFVMVNILLILSSLLFPLIYSEKLLHRLLLSDGLIKMSDISRTSNMIIKKLNVSSIPVSPKARSGVK